MVTLGHHAVAAHGSEERLHIIWQHMISPLDERACLTRPKERSEPHLERPTHQAPADSTAAARGGAVPDPGDQLETLLTRNGPERHDTTKAGAREQTN